MSLLGTGYVVDRVIVNATPAENAVADLLECIYRCMGWYNDANDPVFNVEHLTALALELFDSQQRESDIFMAFAEDEIAKYGTDTQIGKAANGYANLCNTLNTDAIDNVGLFEYNPVAARAAFDFCITSGVFENIEPFKFEECVATANFSMVYGLDTTRKKKLKYIISVLSHTVRGGAWYVAAAASVGAAPNKCSGVDLGVSIAATRWKDNADALKKYGPPL